ncbi:hypothetical protein BU24DRAFT_59440 [Aaosphaeria arxii CBS 175.79]|uniref:Uncharacterized protein n=1 Tax=Aaosphaeria arxii CBS 175.79 TaxID=1450172 RepID=A0A6A5XC84_9PLEO|nr:uncharacterized protein BU24DRAFT_59440 [Aaosphaeria arxii CBS 175.79]KAF2010501.1 hypothetical protein BU24DRAFT_59440 [Aaosphaeria arxii CBS 175.79]
MRAHTEIVLSGIPTPTPLHARLQPDRHRDWNPDDLRLFFPRRFKAYGKPIIPRPPKFFRPPISPSFCFPLDLLMAGIVRVCMCFPRLCFSLSLLHFLRGVLWMDGWMGSATNMNDIRKRGFGFLICFFFLVNWKEMPEGDIFNSREEGMKEERGCVREGEKDEMKMES